MFQTNVFCKTRSHYLFCGTINIIANLSIYPSLSSSLLLDINILQLGKVFYIMYKRITGDLGELSKTVFLCDSLEMLILEGNENSFS